MSRRQRSTTFRIQLPCCGAERRLPHRACGGEVASKDCKKCNKRTTYIHNGKTMKWGLAYGGPMEIVAPRKRMTDKESDMERKRRKSIRAAIESHIADHGMVTSPSTLIDRVYLALFGGETLP